MNECYFYVKKEEYDDSDESTAEMDRICVCCSSRNDIMISINTCKHTSFLENNIENKMILTNCFVCTYCHKFLQKIELFKQQIEDTIALLTGQVDSLQITKIQNLVISPLLTDTIEPDEVDEFKSERDDEVKSESPGPDDSMDLETEVKVEHDSDFDFEVPLAQVSKRNKRPSPLEPYGGKIRVVTLSMAELMEEREELKKQPKFAALPFKCDNCVTAFDHEATFKSHVEKKHKKSKNNALQCDICQSFISTLPSLKEHTKRHLRRLECMVCGKRYNCDKSAIHHYDDKHSPPDEALRRVHKCQECGYSTTTNRAYRYHMDKHKQNRGCKLCGHTFATVHSLKVHMMNIHTGTSRSYTCECCNKRYRAKSGLAAHIRSVHGAAPRAYCTQCRTHYSTLRGLQAHLSTHSAHVTDQDKRYICDECGAKFVKKCNLKTHINWEHLKVGVHQCTKCNKVFKRVNSLRRHMNYVHLKQRPPRNKICHFCGRGFTTQSILQSHLRTHTGERPLSCKHCTATFAHTGALYTHIKLKHTHTRKVLE